MTSIIDQQQFYNSRWADFQYANRLKLERCVAILNALRQTHINQPRIVDLGCGSGWLTSILGHWGPTVGVELSDDAVNSASLRYSNAHFLQADIFRWDYPDEEFDIVVSQEVIEHVEDQSEYLNIAHRLLRPKGYLILTTPNARTFNAMTPEQRTTWSHQPIEKWLTVAALRRLIAKRFCIVELRTIIPGYGVRGSYRLVNSRYVKQICQLPSVGWGVTEALCRMNYGLHTVLLARKI